MVGEGGPEAIVPLWRAKGLGGGGVVVGDVNISTGPGDLETVARAAGAAVEARILRSGRMRSNLKALVRGGL